MAYADVVDSRLVRLWVNTESKAGGTRLCAMMSKSFNQTKQTNDQAIPDCNNPALPAITRRTVASKDAEITGSGLYTHQERAVLQGMFEAALARGMVFELPPSVNGTVGVYYHGLFHLTQFNIVANEAEFVQAELTWAVDGAYSAVVG